MDNDSEQADLGVNTTEEKRSTKQHDIDHNGEDTTTATKMDIDPENEVIGMKLYIIHAGICFATFLIGLVRSFLIRCPQGGKPGSSSMMDRTSI